jgi:flagellum-specific peptidoglycan hydrolase FlgJ
MTKAEKIQWLEQKAPAAQAAARKWGVPASITLAQAFLESADSKTHDPGQSDLALQLHNFFGVKRYQRKLEYSEHQLFPTPEFRNGRWVRERASFQEYASAEESFEDHARLLAQSPRYRKVQDARPDPWKIADALQECKYATDPGYTELLKALMRQYRMVEKFDVQQEKA